mmetsp:Transcript_21730/g.10176  ORF Transcript_21730/g.10176 Transcript_21730/m.10176 type:complete len:136 (-) Transcript_21730:5122-5529(-)
MIGILIVTHCELGDSLIKVLEFITKTKLIKTKLIATSFVSIDVKDNAEKLRKKIQEGIKKNNQDKGVLILTDMFGGTPSNLSYSFLKEGKIEVISGVNLPILLEAVGRRENMELNELGIHLEEFGKKAFLWQAGF